MTIEERKARIAEIQSHQLALLTRVIEISKKLEKKRVKNSVQAAIDSAISMVALGLEIRILEAEKQIIVSAPLTKADALRPEGMAAVPEKGYAYSFTMPGPDGERFMNELRQFKRFEINAGYPEIVKLLHQHGFILNSDGGMRRPSTGCSFSLKCLAKYKSVLDFQLEWPYGADV